MRNSSFLAAALFALAVVCTGCPPEPAGPEGSPSELLRLEYAVDPSLNAFVATSLPSLERFNAGLREGAVIDLESEVVDIGAGGYVDLTPRVGELLHTLPRWSIETYVYIPAGYEFSGSGHSIFSLAREETITGDGDEFGPTITLKGDGVELYLAEHGWGGYHGAGTDFIDRDTAAAGSWKHIVVTWNGAGAQVYLDGLLVREGSMPFKTTAMEPFRYCYLGRSAFHANGDSTLQNARFYACRVYSGVLTQDQIRSDLDAASTLKKLAAAGVPIVGFTFTPAAGLEAGADTVQPGAVVGTFGSPRGGTGAFTYSLIMGAGDANNDDYEIAGTSLKIKAGRTIGGGFKTVRVQAEDSRGETLDRVCTFTVLGATADMLLLAYEVNAEGSRFEGKPASGDAFEAPLTNAVIADNNGKKVVDIQSDGYITLGRRIGDLLHTMDSWTLETYVYIPPGYSFSGGGHKIFAFAADDAITSAKMENSEERNRIGPTMSLEGNAARFWMADHGWGWEDVSTRAVSGADTQTTGAWKQVVVTMDAGQAKVYLNGVLTQEGGLNRRTAAMDTMVYGYLGRSAFHANNDSTLQNARFYRFAMYSGALSPAQIANELGAPEILAALNGGN